MKQMTLVRLSSIGLASARSIDVNMNALKLHRQLGAHRTPMQRADTATRVELMLFAIWTSVCQRVCAVYLHSLTFLLSAETSLLKAELKLIYFYEIVPFAPKTKVNAHYLVSGK